MKKAKIIALAVAVVISTATFGLAAPEYDRSTDLERSKPKAETLHSISGDIYTDNEGRRFTCVNKPPKYLYEDENEDDGFPKGGGA